ncbi:MAG: hypothetical protein ACI3XT_08420 [Butyricicoccaceae bacterium]
MNFAVIGGDRRMDYAAAALAHAGHMKVDRPEQAEMVLLPMPLTADGVHIHGTEETLPALLASLPRQTVVFGGGVYPGIRNYAADEVLCLRNAALTAEGALAIAAEKSPGAIRGSRCLVLGGGRIGMCLCGLLTAMCAHVTLFARRAVQREQAALRGAEAVDAGGLGQALRQSSVIFNTIPARTAQWDDLLAVPAETLWIELASSPFGIPSEAVGRLTFRYQPAGGLPGRLSPKAAGEVLADTVLRMLAAPGEHGQPDPGKRQGTQNEEGTYAAE